MIKVGKERERKKVCDNSDYSSASLGLAVVMYLRRP